MKHKKMANAKIDFSFENLHFSCEGENQWVERQLNNVLSRIPSLLTVHKKGEGIVEEVIDIMEEEISTVPGNSQAVRGSGAVKSSKKAARKKKDGSPKVSKKVKEAISNTVQDHPLVETEIEKGPASDATVAKGTQHKAKKAKKDSAKSRSGSKLSAKKPSVKSGGEKSPSNREIFMDELIDSPLARFLMANNAEKNQVRKFLATAVFLSRSNNINTLTTPMISKALKSYGIAMLQNASDCLNKNEKKGNCIKAGKEFSISDAGFQAF
jgi:hypothetical protein